MLTGFDKRKELLDFLSRRQKMSLRKKQSNGLTLMGLMIAIYYTLTNISSSDSPLENHTIFPMVICILFLEIIIISLAIIFITSRLSQTDKILKSTLKINHPITPWHYPLIMLILPFSVFIYIKEFNILFSVFFLFYLVMIALIFITLYLSNDHTSNSSYTKTYILLVCIQLFIFLYLLLYNNACSVYNYPKIVFGNLLFDCSFSLKIFALSSIIITLLNNLIYQVAAQEQLSLIEEEILFQDIPLTTDQLKEIEKKYNEIKNEL